MGNWCILQCGSASTLPLARSLTAAGIEAWSPAKTIKRPRPGQRRRLALGLVREKIEVAVPILPNFVFVRAVYLADVLRILAAPFSPHPAFTLLRGGDRVPEVSDRSVEGLREAEAAAEAKIQAVRVAESREAARRHRADQMRTERARQKALRAERRTFTPGQEVTVQEMPALDGVQGRIVKGDGTSATIDFGGMLTMKVDAWRVCPVEL